MAECVSQCGDSSTKRKLDFESNSESSDDPFADSGSEYIPSEDENSIASDVNDTVSIFKVILNSGIACFI